MNAVSSVSAELSVELEVPLEERDWRHRWKRLQAHAQELSSPRSDSMSGDSIRAARNDLHSFYIDAYHLKDALKNDASSLGLDPQSVEDAVS